jgi:ABC-type branched-subunit amino acid transport system ATPase component
MLVVSRALDNDASLVILDEQQKVKKLFVFDLSNIISKLKEED